MGRPVPGVRPWATRVAVLGVVVFIIGLSLRHDWLAELGAVMAVMMPLERAIEWLLGWRNGKA